MKIQLLSDLHLESHPHFVPEPAPDADLLVLAGDIGSYQSGSLLTDPDFGLARFSPLHSWPTPVLFLPGNHEYDGLDFDQAHDRLRETCERLGMVWLEREVVQVDGVRFVGTTLWSDFDALAPAESDPGATLATLLRARDKAFRAANYYLRKNTSMRRDAPMLAQHLREQGLLCQQWLRNTLAQPCPDPTVVVTHFAPSLRSADPRYGLAPGTAGFCNRLDDLLVHADLWLHGHLHAPSDYVHRGCRVVANPLGYAGKDEQQAFLPRSVIVLEPRRQVAPQFDAHQAKASWAD